MHLPNFTAVTNLPSNLFRLPLLSLSLSLSLSFLSICQFDIFIYICMPLCMLQCINIYICQYWKKKWKKENIFSTISAQNIRQVFLSILVYNITLKLFYSFQIHRSHYRRLIIYSLLILHAWLYASAPMYCKFVYNRIGSFWTKNGVSNGSQALWHRREPP